jgi:hypothetical protein
MDRCGGCIRALCHRQGVDRDVLARSTVASAYGAAASLIFLLVWVYYMAQILLLGAEVMQTRFHALQCLPALGL